jgi:hypothetical protein
LLKKTGRGHEKKAQEKKAKLLSVQTTQDANIQPMERQRTVFVKAGRKRDIFF